MNRRKITSPRETGRSAFVQMGEWDGSHFALEGQYPVVRLPDGQHAVLLGDCDLPPLEQPSADMEAIMNRRRK